MYNDFVYYWVFLFSHIFLEKHTLELWDIRLLFSSKHFGSFLSKDWAASVTARASFSPTEPLWQPHNGCSVVTLPKKYFGNRVWNWTFTIKNQGLFIDHSKGPFLYYVRVFWGFIEPPTHLHKDISLHKIRENCHFLDHPPTPMSLRNIKMAPNQTFQT